MKNFIVLTMVCLVALVLVPQIHFANASLEGKVSEKQYVNIRAEVWNLFFRMTTAAFVVGAIVSESTSRRKRPDRCGGFGLQAAEFLRVSRRLEGLRRASRAGPREFYRKAGRNLRDYGTK